MEDLSHSLQTSGDDDSNLNNPSSNNQRDNVVILADDSIVVIDNSIDSYVDIIINSSEDSTVATNDQTDSSEKVKRPITNSVGNEVCSKNKKLDILNYTETQKSTELEKVNKDDCSPSNSGIKSRHEPQSIVYPRVNCPEKIIICLDLNEEMDSTVFRSRAGDKYTGLELAKRTIKMFVMHKTQMNPKNEFAFLIFHEDSTMIHSFTPKAQDMLNTLDEIEIETLKSGPMNISHLFETVKENVELPFVSGDPTVIPPPFIVRVILVFGRSHCVPIVANTKAQSELESSPFFFTDVLYIHNPPSEENKCEEIFHNLCELDHNGMSYIFEQSKYTPILNSGAKLLAHPLQRPRQLEAMYKIGASVPAGALPTPAE